MRKTPLIVAAFLASSAAGAQPFSGDCRGQTLSEVARCAAERAPAPEPEDAPEAEKEAPLTPQRLQPRSLGGALQPTNQRRAPAVAGRLPTPSGRTDARPAAPPAADPLRGLASDPTSQFYGMGGARTEGQRSLDPLAGTGVRDRGIAGR